jgi:hypothetical protein
MAPSVWKRATARVFRLVQVGPAAGFMTFWAVACSVWTGMWLLADLTLVPHGIGLPGPHLVAIGVATAMCPIAVMLCGRALMSAGSRLLFSLRTLLESLTTRGEERRTRIAPRERMNSSGLAQQGGPSWVGSAPLDSDRLF